MKASIRSVAMVGVLALVLFACNDSTDTVDNLRSTTSGDNGTTTTTSTTTTSTEAPTCSAAGLTISSGAQPNDLPAAVSELRSELLAAATACDFERLGSMAEADGTSYTFGEAPTLPPTGATLRQTARHLWPTWCSSWNSNPPSTTSAKATCTTCGRPCTPCLIGQMQPRSSARSWPTSSEPTSWQVRDSFGGYVDYRVGITADGRWAFFVAGD